MQLQIEELNDFETTVRNIHDIAFTSGEKYLRKVGKDIKDIKSDHRLQKSFIGYCHKGYDRAQKLIAEEIIQLYELKCEKEIELKNQAIKRNKEISMHLMDLLSVINNRILVLRRIVDSIAFTLFNFRVWITRRFILFDRVKEIDINAIKANLKSATEMNAKDWLKFALVCDLTTFVEVGDLIQIDFHKHPPEWRIIEIKEGKVNALLTELLDEKVVFNNEEKRREVIEKISGHAPSQFNRMLKQRKRMDEIVRIVHTDEGTDIKLDKTIRLVGDELDAKTYLEVINRAIENAKLEKFSAQLVDQCLIVLASSRKMTEILHILYHLKSGESDCTFYNSNKQSHDIEIKKIYDLGDDPFVVDMFSRNMHSKSSTPFFVIPVKEMFDVVFNRMKVVLCLDIEKFAEFCLSKGFKLELVSKKETEGLRKDLGRFTVPSYNGRALVIQTPRGKKITLLGGTFHRILVDLMRPAELLRAMKESDKQVN
jgi:hypothetical protein